jgi:hypothetical protein
VKQALRRILSHHPSAARLGGTGGSDGSEKDKSDEAALWAILARCGLVQVQTGRFEAMQIPRDKASRLCDLSMGCGAGGRSVVRPEVPRRCLDSVPTTESEARSGNTGH